MKKFGISAIFALVFSIGLWAEPAEIISNPTMLFTSAGITQSVDNGIPSGSLQLMSSSDDDVADGIADLIVEILGYLWGYNNLGVTYDSYPYATHPRYMCFDATSGYFDMTFPNHFYRFALDTSMFWDMGLWMGNSTRFEGALWKFFGPVVELNSYFNTDSENPYLAESGYKGNLRIGGDFALLQTNPISVWFYMQWNHYINIPLDNSMIVGFILRSYPIKPILIEWRVDWQFLNEFEKAFFESHLEVGAMVVGPLEAFAAWNFKKFPGFDYSGHGVEAGVRLHF